MENSRLQAEFTNWLDTLAYHTKIDYIKKEKKHNMANLIDEFQEDRFLIEDTEQVLELERIWGFDFSIEWLEKAFVELSDTSKKILYLHVIEGKTLTEIANVIGYSYRHTKRLYSLSIEELRIYKEKHYGN